MLIAFSDDKTPSDTNLLLHYKGYMALSQYMVYIKIRNAYGLCI